MDYVRSLLLEIEERPAHEPWSRNLGARSPDDRELAAYLKLLQGAGFVEVDYFNPLHRSEIWDGVNLTWAGHEFLDNVRSDTVWAKTKDQVKTTVGTASIQVFAQIAAQIALKLAGAG